jgi:hypothetical protein
LVSTYETWDRQISQKVALSGVAIVETLNRVRAGLSSPTKSFLPNLSGRSSTWKLPFMSISVLSPLRISQRSGSRLTAATVTFGFEEA